MKRRRQGITLVEVMLAGAIVSLLMGAFLVGIVSSAKVSRESSEILAAEAYAWDTAWKWFNKKDDDLNDAETPVFYPDGNGAVVASNECPVIYREDAAARCFVRVTGKVPADATSSAYVKRIDVNVEWGAADRRRRLNQIGVADGESYNVPVTIYKSPINRGE